MRRARRVALDIESNGLFKYKATLCTMQLAADGEVAIVDALAVPLGAVSELLGPEGPPKIIHDVAFDARILAESGLVLANVLDTSIAARMLGRTATGLASLLGSELGIAVDKKLQHHDWSERPIQPHHLQYLAADVLYLEALADKLWKEVEAPRETEQRGISDAVEEETRYRLAQAVAATSNSDPRPPYLRLKGIEGASKDDLPILRRLAALREHKAKSLDVPPYKVLSPDVLFAIAKARPRTLDELARVKGAAGGHRARSLGPDIVEAVAAGIAECGVIPDAERAMLERPRLPPAIVKARRARETRLTSWRKAEAARRGLDEQVVLPGHCLQDLADLGEHASLDTIASVPGLGAFRLERDGASLLAAITAKPTTLLAADAETP